MSYEGYTQNICEKGHLFERDCYSDEPCHCGTESAWSNSVDQTNGEDVGIILDFDKVLIQPATYETCNLGHTHTISEALYRIPVEGELQKYWKPFDSAEYKAFK